MSRIPLLTIAIAVLAAVFLMGARVYLGNTFAFANGDVAGICDHQRDLRDAYVVFSRAGSTGVAYVKDENGVRSGCGHSGSRGRRVDMIQACDRSPFSIGRDCTRQKFI